MSRYFILFCSLLIIVWLALQFVINERITEQARVCATRLFTWNWPGLKARSSFADKSIRVLKRDDTQTIVVVSGLQKLYLAGIKSSSSDQIAGQQCDTYTVSATLSFYKMSGNWLLGKVELQ